MKKIKLIAPVVLVIAMLLTLCSCSKKEVITTEIFENKAQELGYSTTHNEDYVAAEDVVIACDENSNSNESFQMEFFQMTSENSASTIFNQLKNSIQSEAVGSTYANASNWSSFKANTNTTYYRLIRVENTLFCAEADIRDKDTIDAFVEAIGY